MECNNAKGVVNKRMQDYQPQDTDTVISNTFNSVTF